MRHCPNAAYMLRERTRGWLVPAPCRRWDDREFCGPIKAAAIGRRAALLKPNFMISITAAREYGECTRENYERLQDGSRAFWRYVQRHFATRTQPLLFCKVVERGSRGERRLHQHRLVRVPKSKLNPRTGRFTKKNLSELQEAAKRCGVGVIDVKVIWSVEGAVHYVTDYISKDLDAPLVFEGEPEEMPELVEPGLPPMPDGVGFVSPDAWRPQARRRAQGARALWRSRLRSAARRRGPRRYSFSRSAPKLPPRQSVYRWDFIPVRVDSPHFDLALARLAAPAPERIDDAPLCLKLDTG